MLPISESGLLVAILLGVEEGVFLEIRSGWTWRTILVSTRRTLIMVAGALARAYTVHIAKSLKEFQTMLDGMLLLSLKLVGMRLPSDFSGGSDTNIEAVELK